MTFYETLEKELKKANALPDTVPALEVLKRVYELRFDPNFSVETVTNLGGDEESIKIAVKGVVVKFVSNKNDTHVGEFLVIRKEEDVYSDSLACLTNFKFSHFFKPFGLSHKLKNEFLEMLNK